MWTRPSLSFPLGGEFWYFQKEMDKPFHSWLLSFIFHFQPISKSSQLHFPNIRRNISSHSLPYHQHLSQSHYQPTWMLYPPHRLPVCCFPPAPYLRQSSWNKAFKMLSPLMASLCSKLFNSIKLTTTFLMSFRSLCKLYFLIRSFLTTLFKISNLHTTYTLLPTWRFLSS